MFAKSSLILVCSFNCVVSSVADDWPQWNGPTRDGVLRETDIVGQIPAAGLPLLWEAPVALGYSGPAVAGGRVVVTDYIKRSGIIRNNPGRRDKLRGTERIQCFDAASGRLLWKHDYDCNYAVSYGSGPRATPTLHAGLAYTLGAEGNLFCFDMETGNIVWKKDFSDDFGATTPLWGHSASPLIHGDSLICIVGGTGSQVVAFDRTTGDELWRSLKSRAQGYCSPTIITAGGTQQLIVWDPAQVHGLDPDNGKEYWAQRLNPGYGMSILPPVVEGDQMYLSAEGDISAMFQLSTDRPDAKIQWRGNVRSSVYLATSAAMFVDGHLYGSDAKSGALTCAQAVDGKRLWETTVPTAAHRNGKGYSNGSAFLIRTATGYLIFSETGDFISANLSPAGYQETGRFHAIDPTEEMRSRKVVWTFPAISDGRLFLRNGEKLVCYDVRQSR